MGFSSRRKRTAPFTCARVRVEFLRVALRRSDRRSNQSQRKGVVREPARRSRPCRRKLVEGIKPARLPGVVFSSLTHTTTTMHGTRTCNTHVSGFFLLLRSCPRRLVNRRCTRRNSGVTTSCRASGRSWTRIRCWASRPRCERSTCTRALSRTCRYKLEKQPGPSGCTQTLHACTGCESTIWERWGSCLPTFVSMLSVG